MSQYESFFSQFARNLAKKAAQAWVFGFVFILIFVVIAFGQMHHFDEQWQRIILISTNLITFLMVFLLQYTLKRDNEAIHRKIEELINVTIAPRSLPGIGEEPADAIDAEFEEPPYETPPEAEPEEEEEEYEPAVPVKSARKQSVPKARKRKAAPKRAKPVPRSSVSW